MDGLLRRNMASKSMEWPHSAFGGGDDANGQYASQENSANQDKAHHCVPLQSDLICGRTTQNRLTSSTGRPRRLGRFRWWNRFTPA
jgi:hypothetical protein